MHYSIHYILLEVATGTATVLAQTVCHLLQCSHHHVHLHYVWWCQEVLIGAQYAMGTWKHARWPPRYPCHCQKWLFIAFHTGLTTLILHTSTSVIMAQLSVGLVLQQVSTLLCIMHHWGSSLMTLSGVVCSHTMLFWYGMSPSHHALPSFSIHSHVQDACSMSSLSSSRS